MTIEDSGFAGRDDVTGRGVEDDLRDVTCRTMGFGLRNGLGATNCVSEWTTSFFGRTTRNGELSLCSRPGPYRRGGGCESLPEITVAVVIVVVTFAGVTVLVTDEVSFVVFSKNLTLRTRLTSVILLIFRVMMVTNLSKTGVFRNGASFSMIP